MQVLLGFFDRLVNAGATVIVIEHDLDVIANADYVIDLGIADAVCLPQFSQDVAHYLILALVQRAGIGMHRKVSLKRLFKGGFDPRILLDKAHLCLAIVSLGVTAHAFLQAATDMNEPQAIPENVAQVPANLFKRADEAAQAGDAVFHGNQARQLGTPPVVFDPVLHGKTEIGVQPAAYGIVVQHDIRYMPCSKAFTHESAQCGLAGSRQAEQPETQ